MANENSRGTSLRLMILAVALIISIMVSTSTTTAGIFHVGAARTVKFQGKDTLTITLNSTTSGTIVPGVDIPLSTPARVTIPANSPNCYVFVKISKTNDSNDIITWTNDSNLTLDSTSGVYHSAIISTNTSSPQSIDVFSGDKLGVKQTAELSHVTAATSSKPITVTVQACAVQSDNSSLSEARAVAVAQFAS